MARTQRRRLEGSPAPAAVRENLPRPRAATQPAGGGGGGGDGVARPMPSQPRKRGPLHTLSGITPRFITDVISELRKVTWPSFGEVRYLTMVVALVAFTMGMFLGGLDLLFGWIVERLFF